LAVVAPADLGAQTAGQIRTPVPGSNGSSDRARRSVAEPAIEVVEVEGAERTRPGVVLDAVGLRPHRLLTRDAFERAARKLAELPAASSTALTQRPATNGSVRVKAAIQERTLVPKGLADWAVVGGRAVFVGDMKIDVAEPFGAGEVFSTTFRWAENRPRVAFELAVPELGPLPGVTRFEFAWDRQAYDLLSAGGDPFRETRQRAGVGVGDWASSRLAWRAGAALDRFEDRNHVAFNAGVDVRLMSDLVAVMLGVETWIPTNGGSRFAATDLAAAWRSTREAAPPWTAIAGTTVATDAAPMALWPGASAGRGRGVLLRAHPLHSHGIVTSEVFGRRIAYASVERQHIVKTLRMATIGVAGFVDAAQVWRRGAGLEPSPLHVDIGGGLRINAPKTGGMVRVDLGYGLRDGDVQLSAGWMGSWPRR
jgi:hypothetical protein